MKKISRIKTGLWQHYKGKYYRVIGDAKNSETLEDMVVYKALYESPDFGHYQIWVRPLEMFLGVVTVEDVVVPRFKFIGSEDE